MGRELLDEPSVVRETVLFVIFCSVVRIRKRQVFETRCYATVLTPSNVGLCVRQNGQLNYTVGQSSFTQMGKAQKSLCSLTLSTWQADVLLNKAMPVLGCRWVPSALQSENPLTLSRSW